MLRIAVPNKGTLARPAAEMLREAGYRQRTDDRDLVCTDAANEVESKLWHLRLRNKWHRHCPLKYASKPELDSNRTGQDEDAFAKDARDPPDSFAQQEFPSAHNANCLATSSRNFQAAVHETLR